MGAKHGESFVVLFEEKHMFLALYTANRTRKIALLIDLLVSVIIFFVSTSAINNFALPVK
jgi:hypothetical protein